MQTIVQSVSEIEVKVEVEIAAATVDAEYRKQLDKARKRARVKGFRPGKAPRNIVRRMYAQQLASDTASELIQRTWSQALDAVDRPKIGEPSIEPALAQEGKPLKYGLRIQVKPEITLRSWEGIEVAVPPAKIEDEALDAEITRLQQSQKERVSVEDRGADIGDVVIVDTHGKIDGETDERLHTHGMEIRLGEADLIPGLADQLIGIQAGEEREVEITFPEDYRPPDLAGVTATLAVTVKEHFFEEVPALDDDLAVDLGHESLADMRAKTAEKLQSQADEARARQAEEKLVAVLLERHPFKAPPAMVQAQFQHQARMMMFRMQIQGAPEETAMQILEQSRDQILQQSAFAVKRYLALEALAQQQELSVTDEQLEAEIADRVAQQPNMAKRFEEDQAREGVRLELLEKAALALLRDKAVITDLEPAADEGALDTAAPVDDDAGTGAETGADEGAGDPEAS